MGVLYGPAMVVANMAGAAIVLIFLLFILPTPEGISVSDDFIEKNLVRFGIYAGVAIAVGWVWTVLRIAPVLRWLITDRDPTEDERRLALRVPLLQTRLVLFLWLASLPLFVPEARAESDELGRAVAGAIVVGGLVTSALTFLIGEQFLRGLARQALDGASRGRPLGPGVSFRIVLAWTLGGAVPLTSIGMALLTNDDVERLRNPILFLAGTGLITGLVAILLALRTVSDPIRDVARTLARVADGDLSVEVPVYDGSEIGLLQSGVNDMVRGLRERERLADLFGRHVGVEVARRAVEHGVSLGGSHHRVAVLFIDVVASTSLAERLPPEEVLTVMNRLFNEVVDVVDGHGGWVNKFVGDEAMCVWGAPAPDPDAATSALACARQLDDRLRAVIPELAIGIGVSFGDAVAGNLGSERRLEFTVLGDPVNEAARLTDEAKRRPERVLASASAVAHATDEEARLWTTGPQLHLRGRDVATVTHVPASVSC